MRSRRAGHAAQQGQSLGSGGKPRDLSGISTGDDLRELGRDDLEDRGLHEEPLQLVLEIADDLLGEVVVQLVVGAVQPADEPPDLGRGAIAQGRLDELERCDPALGPRGEVVRGRRLEPPPVRLGEELRGLRRVEAQIVGAELGHLADRSQPATAGSPARAGWRTRSSGARARSRPARARCAGHRARRRPGGSRRGSGPRHDPAIVGSSPRKRRSATSRARAARSRSPPARRPSPARTSGSCSRPAATRWCRNETQSRSSSSSRYHSVRSRVRREKSARRVVLP